MDERIYRRMIWGCRCGHVAEQEVRLSFGEAKFKTASKTYEYLAPEGATGKSLLSRIEKKVAERSKISQLELLAGEDEEARALLEAYKAIGA